MNNKGTIIFFVVLVVGIVLVQFVLPTIFTTRASQEKEDWFASVVSSNKNKDTEAKEEIVEVFHIETPEPLKAIYMSSCVAATPTLREKLAEIANTTEINSIVIDIKDYSGRLSFAPNDYWNEYVSSECHARDMIDFVKKLHDDGIYVIGRITVFQDPYFANKHKEFAVKKDSDKSQIWKDKKGLSFLDAGSEEVRKHFVKLASDSYDVGFDEINFDYIRFPSDGDMKDIYFEHSVGKNKADVMESFFEHLHNELKPKGIVMSADLFGMTTTNYDDLNIGQVLERALPYFDYVAPMVYPSHYPTGFMNFKDPNKHVYEVINHSMSVAVKRAEATTTPIKTLYNERIGTSTPAIYTHEPVSRLKLRPWLQDFDYGGNYDIAEVKAQIKATYDAGLTSWFLWSPSNRYTTGALIKDDKASNQ